MEEELTFEVYKKEEKKEKVVRFRLSESPGKDEIVLDLVDERGELLPQGILAIINSNGIFLCEKVTPSAGLPLDADGRIKLIPSQP